MQGLEAADSTTAGETSKKSNGRRGRKRDPPATVEKLDSAMESYWGTKTNDEAGDDENGGGAATAAARAANSEVGQDGVEEEEEGAVNGDA